LHRWQKALDPAIHKGKWTPDEDKRLLLAYKASEGSNIWSNVLTSDVIRCRLDSDDE
jgi:hypothetical protein